MKNLTNIYIYIVICNYMTIKLFYTLNPNRYTAVCQIRYQTEQYSKWSLITPTEEI